MRLDWPVLAVAVVLLVMGGGCTVDPPTAGGGRPPTFHVQVGGTTVALPAWTYCLPGVCVDGVPPANPISVGSPEAVTVTIDQPGWNLAATLRDTPAPCTRQYAALTTALPGGSWRLEPAGPAGPYDVQLSAAAASGDASATFRWTTPNDGARPFTPAPCT